MFLGKAWQCSRTKLDAHGKQETNTSAIKDSSSEFRKRQGERHQDAKDHALYNDFWCGATIYRRGKGIVSESKANWKIKKAHPVDFRRLLPDFTTYT